jgi:hypothetical protein
MLLKAVALAPLLPWWREYSECLDAVVDGGHTMTVALLTQLLLAANAASGAYLLCWLANRGYQY